MTLGVMRERPTNGRLVQRGVGPVQPQARVEVVTSAAAPWRRSAYPETTGRPPLTEEELFFGYRRLGVGEGD